VALGDRPELLREFVRRSTRMTHTDPRAEQAALAIAWAAYLSSIKVSRPADVADRLGRESGDPAGELSQRIHRAIASADAGQPTEAFAADLKLGRGVTGYVLHSVPVVLQAWLRFPEDYASAVRSVIRCGGDADTTAALVGAIVGARVGVEGIPEPWRAGLAEWPRNLRWIARLGRELARGPADGRPRRPVPMNPVGLVSRNMVFAGAVLAHVVRRTLPPY
jgi:ADP-ribosylglycohydrolase